MTDIYDCADAQRRTEGLEVAVRTLRGGGLVVLPTDTVYGIGCDAFNPHAVAALLRAKGRGPDMPVPVLVGSVGTLDGLAAGIDAGTRELVAAFWPGPLTLVCRAQPSLQWDLGDTAGTVALRMPEHPVALELLQTVGPMAVSSANKSGSPATTAADAAADLGEAVRVYLDGGATAAAVPSTIVDVTATPPRVVRVGALQIETLRTVCPGLAGADSAN